MHWQSVLGVNYQLQAQPQMQKDFFIHSLAWNNKESNRLWRRELSSYLPPNWMRVWEPGRESKVCVRAAGRDRFRGRLKFSQTEHSFMCVIICCTLEHYGNPPRESGMLQIHAEPLQMFQDPGSPTALLVLTALYL